MIIEPEIRARIEAVFADAGCDGWLHARQIGSTADRQIDVRGTELVVAASVYKVPLLVALCRMFDGNALDPRERITLIPQQSTAGATGLSTFTDPVTISWRDLAVSMITASDNAAADRLLEIVGLQAIADTLDDLGLERTRVVGGTSDLHALLMAETQTSSARDAFAALAHDEDALTVSAYDAAYTSATTAEEMTRLLDLIWTGQAASPAQTAFIRTTMARQIWQHRINAGFPHTGVEVAGKTGTIGVIRNEISVVTFADETPIAVAVFTRAARSDPELPAVDAAIAEVARIAVTELRSGS